MTHDNENIKIKQCINRNSNSVQLCPTLCDPMDCSPSGSPVHGISQARILEWVAIFSPGDLLDAGTEPTSPALAGSFFTTEPPGKPNNSEIPWVLSC